VLCIFLHSCQDAIKNQSSSPIILNLNDTLNLSFNSNQTTGYKYFWLNQNDKMHLYKEKYLSNSNSNCVGCGGIITFSFIAKKKGKVTLKFGECFLFENETYDVFDDNNCDVSDQFLITIK